MTRVWSASLLLVPLALAAHALGAAPALVFLAGALAIVPLAEWIRRATEQLSAHAGAAIGGLINVTFGNVAELILALFVLRAGHSGVVKAQITGSIIGNLLLGLGVAILVGTCGRDNLRFRRVRASLLASLLVLTVIALMVPALFDYTERGVFQSPQADMLDERLSLGVAILLILVYLANLAYTLVTHRDVFAFARVEDRGGSWPIWRALAVLAAATAVTAWDAEVISSALEATAAQLNVTTFFLGVTVLAVIGNAAEYFTAVYYARREQMGLALTLTVGSSIQVALLVAPILILLSWAMGTPMTAVAANPLELVAIAGAAFAVNAISRDGEVTWFEGVLLLAVYLMLALAFFFATP